MEPDLSANMRAAAWMWFRVCRKCGGEFETSPVKDRLREKARKHGLPVRPQKLCLTCVIRTIAGWPENGGDDNG